MSDATEHLAALVKLERDRRGLTLREAAVEAGLNYTTLWRVEMGRGPSLDTFLALARWLKLTTLSELEPEHPGRLAARQAADIR